MDDVVQQLLEGATQAKAGNWDAAHHIAQNHEGTALGDWLHAVLHKIEGDAANSRYWYAKTTKSYETYSDAPTELDALITELRAL